MTSDSFKVVDINITGSVLSFATARRLADQVAEGILNEPIVIAWYDGIKKEEHPAVPECQHKPGWLAYAEGHDGKLQIIVNQDEYSFIYTDAGNMS